jgi:glutamate-ammonia-ligase adenylyltransferase
VCWRKLPSAHRPEPRFAVISYGKLGGKELGYASDLDLVFLYDDDAPEAPERYARLGQRMTTWLSSRTAAGMLFETDMRLRPNGESGLLVSSLEAFHKYQLASAWVWEHQALTRARYSAGDQSIGERFEAIRREVLCQQRDPDALREEVLKMRQKMMDAHGNKVGELFDIKHGRGGLVDVEFLVQYLVLAHAHRHPQLTGNLGNIALLHMAGDLGLIDARRAKRSADAYRSLRRMQHRQRLNELAARVAPASARHERTAVEALWGEVFGS